MEDYFKQQLTAYAGCHRYIIGYSGGVDSQVLLSLAARILPLDSLLAVHINHHLHPNAAQWADFCRAQAAQLGVSFVVVDVYPQGRSEAAAREVRYQGFQSLLQQGDCLLLGQHQDDQIETVLYRLMRGTGLRGLAGMPVERTLSEGVRLFRPLLKVSREEILAWANKQQLSWVDDPSNALNDYDRNFIRNQITPRLRGRWPIFGKKISLTIDQLKASQQLLDEYLDRDLESLINPFGGLDLTGWFERSVQQRDHLLRRWSEQQGGEGFNRTQLDVLERDLIAAAADKLPELQVAGAVIRRYQNRLYRVLPPPVAEFPLTITLNVNNSHYLPQGCLQVFSSSPGLNIAGKKVELRRRVEGLKCRPLGRNGSRSVKKLMQEASVPPWLRDLWPLVFIDNELVAIPNICFCESQWLTKHGIGLCWVPL